MGGEDLSNQELSVDVDLLSTGRSFASPSLLEFPDEADPSVVAAASGVTVLNDAFDRRRMLRSLRNEGIVTYRRQPRGEVCESIDVSMRRCEEALR